MNSLLHMICIVAGVMFVAGCRRGANTTGDQSAGQSAQIQPGSIPAEAPDWGYLPFEIVRVHDHRQPLDRAPWHAAEGEWQFMDCRLARDSTPFVVGLKMRTATDSSSPFAWGEAILATPDREAATRFVAAFARAFHVAAPASHGNKPPGRLTLNTAVLGSDLKRDPQGGFGGKRRGGWTATKWFLQDEGGEAEVFFNFNIAEKRGEFSEKDEGYREDLVQQLVVTLRDGPLPPRTPENDPNLTLAGPHTREWQRIADANTKCQFSPDGRFIISETTTKGGSALNILSTSRPNESKRLAKFDGWANAVTCTEGAAGPVLLVNETLPKNPPSISSDDPKKLWIVDVNGRRALTLPEGVKNWFAGEHALSPDAGVVALQSWATGPGKKRTQVIHLGKVSAGTWQTAQLPEGPVEFVGWQTNPLRGIAWSGSLVDEPKARRVYELDPANGRLTPVTPPPPGFTPGKLLSPDGKFFVRVQGRERLVIEDVATGVAREFVFHPFDRRHVTDEAVKWASPRHVLFQGSRPALIDAIALKMNFPEQNESGFNAMQFSANFTRALGTKNDGVYLGIVDSDGASGSAGVTQRPASAK